jgi:hypothetical protein
MVLMTAMNPLRPEEPLPGELCRRDARDGGGGCQDSMAALGAADAMAAEGANRRDVRRGFASTSRYVRLRDFR